MTDEMEADGWVQVTLIKPIWDITTHMLVENDIMNNVDVLSGDYRGGSLEDQLVVRFHFKDIEWWATNHIGFLCKHAKPDTEPAEFICIPSSNIAALEWKVNSDAYCTWYREKHADEPELFDPEAMARWN